MKRKVKFTSCAVLALVFALFTFVACGENQNNSEHTHTLVHYEASEANCTEEGNIEYWHCSGCDKKYSDADAKNEITEVTIPLNHTGGTEIRDAKAPTTEAEGYTGDTYCLGCGEKISSGESVEKLDHIHNMIKTEKVDETCTANGNIEYYTCVVCQKIYADEYGISLISAEETVIKASHDLTHHEAKSETCTENGWIEYDTCSKCDYSTYEEIPGEHKLVHHEAKGSTCTEKGWNEYDACSRCNYSTYQELPPKHEYSDDVCILCGKSKYSQGLEFISNGDRTCYVAGIGTCTDIDLIIPLTSPEGDKVTGIGAYAFEYCYSLTSVVIGESVEIIGEHAFYKCSSLTSAAIGESVEIISDYAFAYCSKITSIVIGGRVTSIGDLAFCYCSSLTNVVIPDSVESIGNSAFFSNKGLMSVVIGKRVERIGNYAFLDCNSLASIVMGESVESIGDRVFEQCFSLTSVVIPDGLTRIGEHVFSNCRSLTSIEVDENNQYYKDIDGNLYSKDGKTLIQYATGKIDTSYAVPDGVEIIGDYAFKYCRSLVSVVIGNSVTSIGSYAFAGCGNLTSVAIGDSVTSIGTDAFYYCISLTSIKYSGTEEEWNAITKGSGWDTGTGSYTITYNYTDE